MRTIDATLTSALQAGTGKPFAKGYIGYADGSIFHSGPVVAYKLTATTLEFEMPYAADVGGDQECIWLERGLTVAGSDYTLTTGRFRITSQHYLPDGHQVARGSLFPSEYYSAPGDDTYQNVITAFCSNFGKTALFKDAAASWLAYQFFPDGKSITLNDANKFANLLAQKYLIFMADAGAENVLFYSCDGSLAVVPDVIVSPVDDFYKEQTALHDRCLIWRDENETVHTAGSATDPLHHLGFLPSTASAPARRSVPNLFQVRTRPDLRVVDGDIVQVHALGADHNGFALVAEEYSAADKGRKLPRWETIVSANPVFGNTAGGAMPSTIERVSNYTPLNTGTFNRFLSSSDNNLQAAMETIDDRALSAFFTIWAANALKQTVAAGATSWIVPFCDGLQSDSSLAILFPKAATLKNLHVRIASAQPATGTLVITAFVAGSASAIVVTIPAGSAAGTYSDTTHTAAVAPGDALSLRIKNNATAASAQVNGVTLELAGLS